MSLTQKIAFVFVIAVVCVQLSFPQGTAKHPGIALYEAERYSEAVASLEAATKGSKKDALLWNYLGLSYLESGDPKMGAKALEKAISIESSNAIFHTNLGYCLLVARQVNKAQRALNKALSIDPNIPDALYLLGISYTWENKISDAISLADRGIVAKKDHANSYILKSDALMLASARGVVESDEEPDLIIALNDSVTVLKTGIQAVRNPKDLAILNSELESKEAFLKYYQVRASQASVKTTTLQPPEPGTTPLKIISKPRASYTDDARRNNISGTIVLAILFGASGRIEQIVRLKALGYGLDEQAIRAARQIKFEPATKDGKPIPVVKTFSYGFSIY